MLIPRRCSMYARTVRVYYCSGKYSTGTALLSQPVHTHSPVTHDACENGAGCGSLVPKSQPRTGHTREHEPRSEHKRRQRHEGTHEGSCCPLRSMVPVSLYGHVSCMCRVGPLLGAQFFVLLV